MAHAAAHRRGPRRPGHRRRARAARGQRGLGPHPELRRPPPPAEHRPRPLPAADRDQPRRAGRTAPRAVGAGHQGRPRPAGRGGGGGPRRGGRGPRQALRRTGPPVRHGRPSEISHNFEHAGQMLAVRSEIRKGKALDWVLERVSVVDEDGNPVDRSALEITAERRAGGPLPPATRHQPPTNRLRRGRMESDHDRPGRPPGRDGRDQPSRPAGHELPRPHRRRADQPRRARLRSLSPGCSRNTSSSWARRSTTRSPTSSAPSCCTSSRRTPTRTSTSTSTARVATSTPCSPSTTR